MSSSNPLPFISSKHKRLDASRRCHSECGLGEGGSSVVTRASLIKLPRVGSECTPLPNSFFQEKHGSSGVVIGQAPPQVVHSFDTKFVIMLRNFFIEAVADGSLMAQRKAFATASERPEYRPMGEIQFSDVLGSSGQMAFKTLLSRFFPSATKSEMLEMIRVAFPRPKRTDRDRSVTMEERNELTHLFNMFDSDHSSSISLREFLAATRDMKMVKDDQVYWMYASDQNGDGELSLDEWIRGMHNAYF